MCLCGHLHAWHFFEPGSSTSYFTDFSNPQSRQHVFQWPFLSPFLLLTRGFVISLARYRLLFFKFLGTYCFTKVVRMTLYASVHWLWGGVRCKILGSINKADNLRIILSVWACLAFHKRATYTQTTSTFDTVTQSTGLILFYPPPYSCGASLMAQVVKNPPAMQETWVQSLSWEDPLEKGKATHSSILAWRIPWTV